MKRNDSVTSDTGDSETSMNVNLVLFSETSTVHVPVE